MTLVIPPGFGNAAFIFNGTEGTPEFVTTLGVDLTNYGGDFVSAANGLMTIYGSELGPTTDSLLTLVRVNLAIGQDGPGGSVDSDEAPIPMSRTGTAAPIAMSPVVRKVTNEIGRRGRGRMFLPGVLTQAEVTEGGAINSTRLGTLQTFLDDFYTAIELVLPPVLLHSSAPVDPSPITGFSISPLVGWVRGRIR